MNTVERMRHIVLNIKNGENPDKAINQLLRLFEERTKDFETHIEDQNKEIIALEKGNKDLIIKELQEKLKLQKEVCESFNHVELIETKERLAESELKLARMEGAINRVLKKELYLCDCHRYDSHDFVDGKHLEDCEVRILKESLSNSPSSHILVSKAEVEKVKGALEYYRRKCNGKDWEALSVYSKLADEALALPFLQNLRGREGK